MLCGGTAIKGLANQILLKKKLEILLSAPDVLVSSEETPAP